MSFRATGLTEKLQKFCSTYFSGWSSQENHVSQGVVMSFDILLHLDVLHLKSKGGATPAA
jgi:hypothetical protein